MVLFLSLLSVRIHITLSLAVSSFAPSTISGFFFLSNPRPAYHTLH